MNYIITHIVTIMKNYLTPVGVRVIVIFAVICTAVSCGKAKSGSTTRGNNDADKAGPVIERLEMAVRNSDKFGAEDIFAELEVMIPSDTRMADFRNKVMNLPGPKKHLTVDLGDGITMQFVLIRPGTFLMGDKNNPYIHLDKVIITTPFYLGIYEVTQEQWQQIMGHNPSEYQGAKNPVESVTWDECQNFISKLNEKLPGQFRLPTSAEWEYACRAGSRGDYCYGDGKDRLGMYAWYVNISDNKTHPVGQKQPNAWGLYDMHGNVSEVCQDRDVFYSSNGKSVTNPVNLTAGSTDVVWGPGHVARGGSIAETADRCLAARISIHHDEHRMPFEGLRIAMWLPCSGRLTIVKATYGADNLQRDVKEMVQGKIQNCRLSFRADSGELGGDPIFGRTKTFYIKYMYGGRILEKSYREGLWVSLP